MHQTDARDRDKVAPAGAARMRHERTRIERSAI